MPESNPDLTVVYMAGYHEGKKKYRDELYNYRKQVKAFIKDLLKLRGKYDSPDYNTYDKTVKLAKEHGLMGNIVNPTDRRDAKDEL